MNRFANAIAKAAASSPMGGHTVPVARRVLYADGDGLAYYCAGNDETDAGAARAMVTAKLNAAARACGAERTVVLLTDSGSIKGHRYAIARRKPYQGQRANSRRPKNWAHLRDWFYTDRFPFSTTTTRLAEADDLFGHHAYLDPENTVIYTQDKDMRMLPGIHLDWVDHRTHVVRQATDYAENSVFKENQYGIKWFWLQMLHGDTADHIPGLPKYRPDPKVEGKTKPVGEVTASQLLMLSETNEELCHATYTAYRSYYYDSALVELMEQACLLWMRRVPELWDDCMQPYGPLAPLLSHPDFAEAHDEIRQRVKEADDINAQTQDH